MTRDWNHMTQLGHVTCSANFKDMWHAGVCVCVCVCVCVPCEIFSLKCTV